LIRFVKNGGRKGEKGVSMAKEEEEEKRTSNLR
jgi:hypothetical protein